MKVNRQVLGSFLLLVLIASLYRAFPGRPWGFAPQIAMAVFGGAVLRNRVLAFGLPLLSMLISDLLYHTLYLAGMGTIPGFYTGQWLNYLFIGALTCIGFLVNEKKPLSIAMGALAGPFAYFLISNFAVWFGGGGLGRPKTWEGLLMCYADGMPFYQNSVLATLFFSALLFGGQHLLNRYFGKQLA